MRSGDVVAIAAAATAAAAADDDDDAADDDDDDYVVVVVSIGLDVIFALVESRGEATYRYLLLPPRSAVKESIAECPVIARPRGEVSSKSKRLR
jgi:hypothetical protein